MSIYNENLRKAFRKNNETQYIYSTCSISDIYDKYFIQTQFRAITPNQVDCVKK